MENILEVKDLCKAYSKGNFALKNLSFSLPYGSIMGLVGENGAGKTTAIGCILNTLSKDGGSVRILGREMGDRDADLREKIGVVYDGDNFPGYRTAEQISKIMAGVYKNWDGGLFRRYLRDFRLPENQKIKGFSRGMTMKLAIAAALSHRPQLLILDEATSGLDPVMRDEILDVFLEFVGEENHSILLSSHIVSDLEKVADYITFIQNGSAVIAASKDDLLYNYGILRCKKSRFSALDPTDYIAYRERDYQIDVLVKDRKSAGRKYPDTAVDPGNLEEIMLILAKGERK